MVIFWPQTVMECMENLMLPIQTLLASVAFTFGTLLLQVLLLVTPSISQAD